MERKWRQLKVYCLGLLHVQPPQNGMMDNNIKNTVWQHGHLIPGSSSFWRLDDFGRVMYYSDYGNRSSKWGWEVDHIVPVAQGGTDDLSNLRFLNWWSNLQRQSGSSNT